MSLNIPGWVSVLTKLEDKSMSITEIHLATEITYPYVHKIVKEFEAKKLVWTEKKGRTNIVGLTKKGKTLCKQTISKINEFLK